MDHRILARFLAGALLATAPALAGCLADSGSQASQTGWQAYADEQHPKVRDVVVRLDNETHDLSPSSSHGSEVVTEAFHVLHGVEVPTREASFPAEEELNRSQWVGLEIRENGSIPFPNYTYQNATPSFTWVFIVFTSDVEAGHAGDVLVCNEEIRCSVVASSTPLAPLRETAERAVS